MNLAVTNFRRIEIFLRDAGAERGDQAANFFVRQHLVVSALFPRWKNFPLSGRMAWKRRVAALFGGAACGFSFDQEKVRSGWDRARSSRRVCRGVLRHLSAFAAS